MRPSVQHCHYLSLGKVDYHTAWTLQRRLAEARAEERISDTLIILEHPPTYTLGRSGRPEHLLLSQTECRERGIELVEVDRGGDITYHGPGQIVAYPIWLLGQPDLSGRIPQANYVGYIRKLEEVLIQAVAPFGVRARREVGLTGVWVDTESGPSKLAAIGVRISARGVSTHGAALNVDPDLSYFEGIVPCGIANKGVTSLRALLGRTCPSVSAVRDSLTKAFESVFGCQLTAITLEQITTLIA